MTVPVGKGRAPAQSGVFSPSSLMQALLGETSENYVAHDMWKSINKMEMEVNVPTVLAEYARLARRLREPRRSEQVVINAEKDAHVHIHVLNMPGLVSGMHIDDFVDTGRHEREIGLLQRQLESAIECQARTVAKAHTLEEHLALRSNGLRLMVVSGLCASGFAVGYGVSALTPLKLLHPALSSVGFICSVGFFLIGRGTWIKCLQDPN